MPGHKKQDPATDDIAYDDTPDPTEDTPEPVEEPPTDMLDEEHQRPHGPSDTDDPPDYIEENDPDDALSKRDPDGPMLDHQDPGAGIKERDQPENPDGRTPGLG